MIILSTEDIFKTGFKETKNSLENLKQQLESANNKLVQTFTENGLDIVNDLANIVGDHQEDEDEGAALENSSHIESIGVNASAIIENQNPRATFIEFGTGMVGKNAPHPNATEHDWEYYILTQYKKTLSDGRMGWFYLGEFRQGITSSPFMWYSAIRIRKLIPQWFNKALKQSMGKAE